MCVAMVSMTVDISTIFFIPAFTSIVLEYDFGTGCSGLGAYPIAVDSGLVFVLWMTVHAIVLIFNTSGKGISPCSVVTCGYLLCPMLRSVSLGTFEGNFSRSTIKDNIP